jgi:hypothetical protein
MKDQKQWNACSNCFHSVKFIHTIIKFNLSLVSCIISLIDHLKNCLFMILNEIYVVHLILNQFGKKCFLNLTFDSIECSKSLETNLK